MSDSNKILMKKEELDKLIKAKTENMVDKSEVEAVKAEVAEKFKADLDAYKAEAAELQKKEIEKAVANRKAIEADGINLFGEDATDRQIMQAKLEKSAKEDGDLTDAEKHLQKAHDRLAILNSVYRKAGKDGQVKETKTYKEFMNVAKQTGYFKAFDETAGDGLEWMPEILSNRLIEYVEASPDFEIPNMFERIPMASSTFKIPREESGVTAYKGSIGGSLTSIEGTATTGNAEFDAEKIIAYSKVYYEAEEDMIISAMPLIERRLVKALTKGVSDAIINGDDSATHMDASVTSGSDRRKLWKGLRKICQTNSYTYSVAGTWTQEKFRKFQNEMAIEFGLDFTQNKFILGKDSYNQIRNLAEVRTAEKAGLNVATVLNGVLKEIDGSMVMPTSLVLDAVNSSGVVSGTAANNTKGQALYVHTPAFGLGVRRSLLLETDKNILTQHYDIVASMRMDFQSLIDETAQQAVVQAVNITTW